MHKVLVVEDEVNIQKLTKANLIASGYQVIVAGKGRDALNLVHAEHPDLVFLDLRLPDMSGWDVLMAIRTSERLRDMPVIIVTAVVPQGGENLFRHLRADGHMIKPFSINDLLQKAKEILEGVKKGEPTAHSRS